MKSYVDRLTDKKSEEMAEKAGELFSSLPHLPKNIVEFLVKLAPFFALLGAVLSLLSSPVLGLLSLLSLITFNPFIVLSVLISAIVALVSAVLLFLAYKPLSQRKHAGWMLLFWSNVLSLVQFILDVVLRQSGLAGIIGLAIAFYILYEMRPFYTGKLKVDSTAKGK